MCLSNDILRKYVLSGIIMISSNYIYISPSNTMDCVIQCWCDVGTFILSFMFPADWNKLGIDFLLYVARAYAG